MRGLPCRLAICWWSIIRWDVGWLRNTWILNWWINWFGRWSSIKNTTIYLFNLDKAYSAKYKIW